MDKFKIVLSAHGRGEVWRNGEKVEGVRSLTVRAGVDQLNVVTLELYAADVEIECVADAKGRGDG